MDTGSLRSNNLLRATHLTAVDDDPEETREWLEALESVVRVAGHERALILLRLLEEQAQQRGIVANVPPYSAYRNTIPIEQEGPYPGNLELEERITSINRWNASPTPWMPTTMFRWAAISKTALCRGPSNGIASTASCSTARRR